MFLVHSKMCTIEMSSIFESTKACRTKVNTFVLQLDMSYNNDYLLATFKNLQY